MLKLKKYQQYLLALLASFIFLLLGLAILAISFFSANRQSAAGINAVFTEPIIPRFLPIRRMLNMLPGQVIPYS